MRKAYSSCQNIKKDVFCNIVSIKTTNIFLQHLRLLIMHFLKILVAGLRTIVRMWDLRLLNLERSIFKKRSFYKRQLLILLSCIFLMYVCGLVLTDQETITENSSFLILMVSFERNNSYSFRSKTIRALVVMLAIFLRFDLEYFSSSCLLERV